MEDFTLAHVYNFTKIVDFNKANKGNWSELPWGGTSDIFVPGHIISWVKFMLEDRDELRNAGGTGACEYSKDDDRNLKDVISKLKKLPKGSLIRMR